MANYLDSRRIMGTDNPNASFVTPSALTDWTKRKQITINGAAKIADFTDDFSIDTSWSQTGTVVTHDFTTDDRVEYASMASTSTDRIHKALGFTLSTKFVVDWDFEATSQTGNNHYGMVSLCAGTSEPFGSSQDAIITKYTINTTAGQRDTSVAVKDGASASVQKVGIDNNSNLDGKIYYRLIRNVDKLILTGYADSERTEVLFSGSSNFTETITGLNTVIIGSTPNTAGGTLTAYIDNLAVYNDTTTVENIPSQQTATYESDFSTRDGFSADYSSYLVVNTTNERIDFSCNASSLNGLITKDLGAGFGSTKFVARWHLHVTNANLNSTAGQAVGLRMGLADSSSQTAEVPTNDQIYWQTSAGSSTFFQGLMGADGSTNTNDRGNDDPISASSDNTDWYFELKRDGNNFTGQFYSDSTFETTIGSARSLTIANVGSLRYLYFRVFTQAVTGTPLFDGYIDDLKIWNNFSEVNPTTLTDFVLPIKIQGDADLQRKTAEDVDLDFSSASGWTTTDSANLDVNTTTEKLDMVLNTADALDSISYDLLGSTVSDSAWVTHFKVNFSTLTTGNTNSPTMFIGIHDGSNSTHASTVDRIGTKLSYTTTVKTIGAYDTDGENIYTSELDAQTYTLVADQDYFFEIARTSTTTYHVKVFLDKAHTILLLQSNGTCSATCTSLRYFSIQAHHGGTPGNMSGTIDDLKFWDGISNPVNQETATHTDDFSTDAWTDQDTKQQVTGGSLAYDPRRDNTNDASSYDLQTILGSGVNVDDSKWCLQYVQNHSSVYTSGNGNRLWFGISDKDSSTAQNGTHDFIGLYQNFDGTSKHGAVGVDGATLPQNNTGTVSPATSTNYYTRISRINKTTMRVQVFTGGYDEVTFYDETLTIASTIQNLRYLWIGNLVDAAGGDSITGTIDDLSFWNGISSPNASGRKIVFTNDDTTNSAIQYPSKTLSYDSINGDYYGEVKIPTLTTGSNFNLYMYYNYNPSANPDYSPETIGTITRDETFDTTTGWTERDATECYIDTINNRIYYNGDLDVTDSTVYYDVVGQLGQAFNGKSLVLRCEPKKIANANLSHRVEFMLSAENVDMHTSQNSVGFAIGANNSFVGRTYQNSATPTDATAFTNTSNGTVEYVEIAIHGKLVTFRTFTDNTYSVLDQEFTLTLTDTMPDFNYIKLMDRSDTSSGSNTLEMEIKNLKIWDNISTFNREKSVHDANYKAVYHLQGNSLDSTVYGNDGTNTAVDWEQQNNSVGLVANGTTTKIDVSADTSINNVWVSGGEVEWTTNLKSDGEASGGRFFDKRGLGFGWTFIGEDEASGLIRIRLLIDFTTTNGQWETTNTVIPINEVVKLTVKYNGDSIENDPILIINGVKYTVGNGLTEVVKPAGSIRSDSSQAFTIANVTVQTTTIDGFMDNVKLSDKIRPSSQAIATYNAEKADSDILTVGSESTPLFSNVETNSVFIKTDTNKRFWYNGTTWVEQA